MSLLESLKAELNAEFESTRRILQKVPDNLLQWRPHATLNTIGWNSNHLAEISGWVRPTLSLAEWDLTPPTGEPYSSPRLQSIKEILNLFDRNCRDAFHLLDYIDQRALSSRWSLKSSNQILFTIPRSAVLRTYVLNHMIHHRGILSVYLRMNEISVDGLYGPAGPAQVNE
ncbi:DinB family protein [Planctomicrobium sp. SH668]|uniref:DinB family protein n=1 Tax=Planctomicrobium sp. SH668 TaxID=3448126 RepID=UPI003F5BBBC1